MTCDEFQQFLEAVNDLDDDTWIAEADTHLVSCTACQKKIEENLRKLPNLLRTAVLRMARTLMEEAISKQQHRRRTTDPRKPN